MQMCIGLFHSKVCPLNSVQNHHIIGLRHAQLLVKTQGIFVVAGVHDDVVLTACGFVEPANKGGSDTHPRVFPDNTQIGDKEPVGEIRNSEAYTDDGVVFVPGYQGDGSLTYQHGDPFPESFLRILGP